MRQFFTTFAIILTLFLCVLTILYLWDSNQLNQIESVRITVQDGQVIEDATGKSISTGEQLTVHANGRNEFTPRDETVYPELTPAFAESTRDVKMMIVDDNQQPVSNAAIALSSGYSQYCGDDGSATFTIPTNKELTATIAADGFFMKSEIPLTNDQNEITVTINRKLSIHGKVLNPDGTPNSDSHITLLDSDAIFSTTNEQFSFYPMPAGEYLISVTHPAYFGVLKSVQAGNTITAQLTNEATATIIVKTEQGEPVTNAKIDVHANPDQPFNYIAQQSTDISGSAIFNQLKRGTYWIEINHAWFVSQQPTEVEIDVTDQIIELYIPYYHLNLSGTVTDAETKQPIANIPVVSVLDYDSLKFSTLFSPGSVTKTVMTDESGMYQFEELRSGRYTVFIDDVEGYISGNQLKLPYQPENLIRKVILTNIHAEDVNFALEKAWQISGTVYDPYGVPLPNQTVTANSLGYYVSEAELWKKFGGIVQTDENGNYEMTITAAIPPDSDMNVMAKHKYYWGGYSDVFKIEPGMKKENVDIHLKGSAIVQGYVRDEQGDPIENAIVQFMAEEIVVEYGREVMDRWGSNATTDAKGFYECIFRFSDFDGEFTGSADAIGYKSSFHNSDNKTIELQMSDTPQTVDFVLHKGEDETISGIVVDDDGNPVEGIPVRLTATSIYRKDEQHIISGSYSNVIPIKKTDANGQFQFEIDFLDTNLIQRTTDSGKLMVKQNIIALLVSTQRTDQYLENHGTPIFYDKQDEIKLVVHKIQKEITNKTSIAGQVITADGNPVPKFDILVVAGSPPYNQNEQSPYYKWTPVYSADGRFQIDNLVVEQGPFSINVRTEELGLASSERLFPTPNEIISGIKIVMGKGATIMGTIIDTETLKPISGINVVGMFPPSHARHSELDYQISRGGSSISAENQRKVLLEASIPSAITNEKGEFILKGAPVPSAYLHILPSNNYDQYTKAIRPLSEGQTLKIDPIRLKPVQR